MSNRLKRAASVAALIVTACGDDSATADGGAGAGGSGDGGNSGGGVGASGQGGQLVGGEGTGGGVPASVAVRLVHLSPDGPPLDFCLLPGSGDLLGPVLEGFASLEAGLSYPNGSAYVDLPSDSYAVRIVAADAADCDQGLGPDLGAAELAAGTAYTIGAIGMLSPAGNDAAFEILRLEDDVTPESGKVRLRFVHTSPDAPAVDVGLGSGKAFVPVWTNVSYSDVGLVAGAAYLTVDPPSNAQLSARATGTSEDALVVDGVSIPPGEVVTTFAIGNVDGSPAALKVLACLDVGGFCLELPAP